MNILSRIARNVVEHLVVDDPIEYQHEPNVVHLDTPFARRHAIANAAQAAMTTEENRISVRRDEINAQLEELCAERERLNVRIYELQSEDDRLRILGTAS
jgi:hypothetical protein